MSALAVKVNLERWHVGGGAHGETLSHCLGRRMEKCKNNENKIHGGVNRPPIGKSTHNNQPKTSSRDGGEHGGDMRQARCVRDMR